MFSSLIFRQAWKQMSAFHLHDPKWQDKENTAPNFTTQASSAWNQE